MRTRVNERGVEGTTGQAETHQADLHRRILDGMHAAHCKRGTCSAKMQNASALRAIITSLGRSVPHASGHSLPENL